MNARQEELIKILKNIYEKEGQIPTRRYINSRKDLPSEMSFRTAFGSWGDALRTAGIEPKKPYPSKKCLENSIKAHKDRIGFNNKGGKRTNKQGYIEVWKPEHPNANKKGYILEHRLIMSEYIGRALLRNEDVHHKDKNKTNNDINNLELMTKSEHAKYHENNDNEKHKGNKRKKCIYPDCNEMTNSKIGLCTKHYKLQWQRLNKGLISDIKSFKEISRKHSEATKKKLSDIAKKQPRKNGKFSKSR